MKTILAALPLSLALIFSLAAHAAGESNVDSSGLALKGYDPVAYFSEKKPVPGKPEFTARHEGATYRFASAANRDAFAAAPAKYAPQYGGYCAFGAASGYKAPIEPDAWTVVDGKLYLNYNRSVRSQWSSDIPGFVRKADANWPAIRSK
ncbi:MAG TPA: YHS domain-containing (seleno)protein [Burkholderiales bacterium]|nr:YHS domain-containing (seleno)protein [Burkholderiales bacterium]